VAEDKGSDGREGGGSGGGSLSQDADEGLEVVTLADEKGLGVYVTCSADLSPADLVAGLCDILGRVAEAALERRPGSARAGDLCLGEDVF
jgi:hypothetical protein